MIIRVNVRPSAREEKIEKISDAEYCVSVKEPPLKGKANLAVIKALAKEFGVSAFKVRIKNPNSRKKVVEIIETEKMLFAQPLWL